MAQVLEDVGDGMMILHHLLVMAAALLRRTSSNVTTHQHVQFDGLALESVAFEQLPIQL